MLKRILTIFVFSFTIVNIGIANSITPQIQYDKTISGHAFGILPSPPLLAVESYLMIDADTGAVLASFNEDKKIHPASLTKLMTTYLVNESIRNGTLSAQENIIVSQKAWKATGSTMFLEAGQKVSIEDLLKGIIIVSGNDASIAIAEHIAGSEDGFAEMMNKMAIILGMKDTCFFNASGMPHEGHYSTAKDLALLSQHVIYDHPEAFKLYSEKYFQYGIDRKTKRPLQEQKNRNRLLWTSPYVDGLKTGHTDDSGYHLIATSMQNDRRIIVVILGANSEKQRAEDAQKLFAYGFNFFTNNKISKKQDILKEVRIWGGKENILKTGALNDILVTTPRGMNDKLTISIDVTNDLEAPILANTVVGSISINLNNKQIKTENLVALQTVEKGGWFKYIFDKIKRALISLFV